MLRNTHTSQIKTAAELTAFSELKSELAALPPPTATSSTVPKALLLALHIIEMLLTSAGICLIIAALALGLLAFPAFIATMVLSIPVFIAALPHLGIGSCSILLYEDLANKEQEKPNEAVNKLCDELERSLKDNSAIKQPKNLNESLAVIQAKIDFLRSHNIKPAPSKEPSKKRLYAAYGTLAALSILLSVGALAAFVVGMTFAGPMTAALGIAGYASTSSLAYLRLVENGMMFFLKMGIGYTASSLATTPLSGLAVGVMFLAERIRNKMYCDQPINILLRSLESQKADILLKIDAQEKSVPSSREKTPQNSSGKKISVIHENKNALSQHSFLSQKKKKEDAAPIVLKPSASPGFTR